MKVKICGIKTLDEARSAVAYGADFLGFNFYPPSPRSISVEDCRQIIQVIRSEAANVIFVGVFVNMPAERILEVLKQCDLDLAQLSGDETLKEQQLLGERAYKALRLSQGIGALSIEKDVYQRKTPPALLVDAYRQGQYGGTGQRADWEMAAAVACQKPIFLAGGLTPDTVVEAIRRVKPWGVDVASGVEAAVGKKDLAKIRDFIRNAHEAYKELRKER